MNIKGQKIKRGMHGFLLALDHRLELLCAQMDTEVNELARMLGRAVDWNDAVHNKFLGYEILTAKSLPGDDGWKIIYSSVGYCKRIVLIIKRKEENKLTVEVEDQTYAATKGTVEFDKIAQLSEIMDIEYESYASSSHSPLQALAAKLTQVRRKYRNKESPQLHGYNIYAIHGTEFIGWDIFFKYDDSDTIIQLRTSSVVKNDIKVYSEVASKKYDLIHNLEELKALMDRTVSENRATPKD